MLLHNKCKSAGCYNHWGWWGRWN